MKTFYTILFFLIGNLLGAQQTVGLFQYSAASFEGYTLFSPLRSKHTFLIDNCGRVVQSWESAYVPSQSSYLLENGHLLQAVKTPNILHPLINAGGGGERVQEIDENGQVLWDFSYFDLSHRMHHDIEPLPNGHVLILAWEYKNRNEAIAAGRDPMLLPDLAVWPEMIVEVKPQGATGGEIVWEWHVWDHLIQDFDPSQSNYGVVGDHPELIDLNFVSDIPERGDADWLHFNSIDYNPVLDQIMFCSAGLNEIYIIDHSTTSAEAASHSGGRAGKGGDFLFRWGNPLAYRRGSTNDQKIYEVHDAHWIPPGLPDAGKILLFNNGRDRPGGDASSVDQIVPPLDANGRYLLAPGAVYGPVAPEWQYRQEGWYSDFISGSQRLPNGNTLICSGAEGRFFEIDPAKNIVWEYINPESHLGPTVQGNPVPLSGSLSGNIVFRATRYSPTYSGIAQLMLEVGEPIELNPLPFTTECEIISHIGSIEEEAWRIYPNPVSDFLVVETPFYTQPVTLKIINIGGRIQAKILLYQEQMQIDLTAFPSGVYWLQKDRKVIGRFLVQRK